MYLFVTGRGVEKNGGGVGGRYQETTANMRKLQRVNEEEKQSCKIHKQQSTAMRREIITLN